MGVHAARKAARIVEHAETVLAIELLAAAQALDFRKPLRAGRGADAAYRAFRRKVPSMLRDRVLAPDIETARTAIVDGTIREAAERSAGSLR